MKAYIYKIENKANGKFYIGSTIRKKHIRKYEHFSMLRSNTHCNKYLQNSWNKYGEENFEFSIVEEFIFPEQYNKNYILEYIVGREAYIINFLNAIYNLRLQNDTRLNYHHSQETIEKIRKSNSGRKVENTERMVVANRKNGEKRKGIKRIMSEKWKENIKKSIRGKGWNHTKEALEKISNRSSQQDNIERFRILQKEQSEKRIGTHKSIEEKMKIANKKLNGKIIEIYDLNMNLIDTAYSAPDASLKTGIKRTAIGNNLAGISSKTKKFIFKYKEVSIV
jgi:group I intron endonuclease